MICPICLNNQVSLIGYDPVYCMENKKHMQESNIPLDDLFHCEVKCFECGYTKWVDALITYPQPTIPVRYCFKDTIDYNAFISWLMINKGAFISRELKTEEEPVKCVLSYARYYKEFQTRVDGAIYAYHRDYNYVLKEYNGLFPSK